MYVWNTGGSYQISEKLKCFQDVVDPVKKKNLSDVLVLLELVHEMEQVLIQDGTSRLTLPETVDLSGWACPAWAVY